MSGPKNKENPATVKARNARPDRARIRSAQGDMHQRKNPEHTNDVQARRRAQKGRQSGIYAQMIEESFNPLIIESDNIFLTGDWHLPFTNEPLVKRLFAAADEHGTKDLLIGGDFLDCDNYSRFTDLTEANANIRLTFQHEIEEGRKELKRILSHFERVFICRGNHEKRWIDLNAGMMGMPQLFALIRPSNISDDEYERRVKITSDDHINLIHNGQLWLCCHPRNYRITPLSVVRDLAANHLCNVAGFHGHAFNQGRDRSGKFRVVDGGGMFDRAALAYTRSTSCHPATRSGFYLLKDGELIAFEGEA